VEAKVKGWEGDVETPGIGLESVLCHFNERQD
jgi:hypothetical protein